jgi:hypothetical protein
VARLSWQKAVAMIATCSLASSNHLGRQKMKSQYVAADGRKVNPVLMFALLAVVLALFAQSLSAQTKDIDPKLAELQSAPNAYQTFYLASAAQQHDATDIVTDLRNMLPKARIYYVASQNAISILGTSDDFLLAQKILSDIDRTAKTYRVTYTITETDNGQRMGTRRVSLIVASGEKAYLKQGNRMPVITAVIDPGTASPKDQFQYVDVGLNIDASLDGPPDGLRLRTRVEQSSVADEKSGIGVQDPVIRQTTLDVTSMLAQGKPLVLGSLDVPGSTRHEEIEVMSEPIQ